jgi:pyruvate/2-oxoglutarate dehydrogenase complex dihydrolipoamide dehydrogenase (E3) component
MASVTGVDRYDLVVIGGGSAGLTAARFAAQVGARVLIAAVRLGGDCTWTGCIPSKALLRAAREAKESRVTVDFTRVMAEVRGAIERVHAHETPEALASRGIDFAPGEARFLDRVTIQSGDRTVRGDHYVLCTGAGPLIPAIPGLDGVPYLTYETVFDLERAPASMIVLGAGGTGVELSQAFARLGTRTMLCERRPSVLADADPEAGAVLGRSLQSDGIDLHVSAEVSNVAAAGAEVEVQAGPARLQAEALLVAAGRRPRVAGLGLERAGIAVHEGAVQVDKNLRTTNPLVYAAGDVTRGFQFTHYAGWQGYVAARNALLPGAQDGVKPHIPWAIFTDPEVAQAGLSEAEARARFGDTRAHRLELERVDRAQTDDERAGFLKLITADGGKLVGAVVVSPVAGETINELALAIERGLTLSDLASTIHAYPTFGFAIQQLAAEVVMEAAATGIRGKAVRALRKLS